jgi:hypothetical protein
MKSLRLYSVLVTLGVVITACTASKSSSPLSPTVAGPIPGVSISAPKMLEPAPGALIDRTKQPITLLLENPSTTGVRPLTLLVEIAADAAFSNKVFSRDGLTPGDGGRTSVRLPDSLAAERTYFWRARAEDGANAGPYSVAADFNVYTPIVIEEPTLVSPAPNSTITGLRPRFVFANASHSGPVGPISYVIELADSEAFIRKAAVAIPEQPSQTSYDTPTDLAYGTVYFWHVRAYDATTTGPWSVTLAFRTPDTPPPPPPPPTPGPSGCTFVSKMNDNTCFIAQAKAELLARGVDLSGECGAFRIVALAASRIPGAGFKRKGGTNCNGYSIKSIMFADGSDFEVLISPGTTNGPEWRYAGITDPSSYAPSNMSGF